MDVFEAIADPVRRALLRELAKGPGRVVDLAAVQPVSRPAVSKHLRRLTEAGLTVPQDRGRERHYVLQPEALAPLTELLSELTPDNSTQQPSQKTTQFSTPITAAQVDALDLEVRRTVRDRRTESKAPSSQDSQEDTA